MIKENRKAKKNKAITKELTFNDEASDASAWKAGSVRTSFECERRTCRKIKQYVHFYFDNVLICTLYWTSMKSKLVSQPINNDNDKNLDYDKRKSEPINKLGSLIFGEMFTN